MSDYIIYASCALIYHPQDDNLVLGVSRKDDHNDWGLPGGKIDPGETALEAVIRETKEETNLDVGAFYCGVKKSEDGWIVYIYGADTYSGEVELSYEHSDYAWLSLDEIAKLTNTTPSLYADVASVFNEIKK